MALRLDTHPVHLARGGAAVVLAPFDGMGWYEAYQATHGADGADGRLVALWAFEADWQSWERHPLGEELVVCLSGALTLIQQLADGSEQRIALRAGDYAINPAGIWHTADVTEPAQALFVTPGFGTEQRPR